MMGAEESGGFGFGMHLPERDGVYADLLAARPVHARARGRALAGVACRRAVPRTRRAVVLPAHRRPRRAGRVPRDEAATAGRPGRRAAERARGRADRPDRAARHRRRLQVLPRRRVVAAHPGVRHRAAGPRSTPRRRRPRRATRCWSPASAWCAAHERRGGQGTPGGSTSRGATSSSGPSRTTTSARSWSSRRASACRSSSTRSRTNRSS